MELCRELQKDFNEFQNRFYFLRLVRCENNSSKVNWVKTFNSGSDFGKFYYDTTHMRACILIKYEKEKERYQLLCQGFFISIEITIWNDRASSFFEFREFDIDKSKMPPRELIEKGFQEIIAAVSCVKGNKAIRFIEVLYL
jgi:hypothetical protein